MRQYQPFKIVGEKKKRKKKWMQGAPDSGLLGLMASRCCIGVEKKKKAWDCWWRIRQSGQLYEERSVNNKAKSSACAKAIRQMSLFFPPFFLNIPIACLKRTFHLANVC